MKKFVLLKFQNKYVRCRHDLTQENFARVVIAAPLFRKIVSPRAQLYDSATIRRDFMQRAWQIYF